MDAWRLIRRQIDRALACLPPELLSIVDGYAKELPHLWQRLLMNGSWHPVNIEKNSAFCVDRMIYRIRSTQSIVDGPSRWRILIQFQKHQSGFVAIGVSRVAGSSQFVGQFNGNSWFDWTKAAGPDDIVVETNDCPNRSNDHYEAGVFHDGKVTPTTAVRRKTLKATVAVEVDGDKMRISDPDDVRFQITVDLPTIDGGVWRPCVVVSHDVCATILPWREPR